MNDGKRSDCEHFFCYRLPYNWRSPIPFFISMIAETIETYFMGVFAISSCSMIIGACMFLMLFCTDFQQCLKSLTKEIEQNAYGGEALPNMNLDKIRKKYYEVIQFHADIRQLSAISEIIQYHTKYLLSIFRSFPFKRLATSSASTLMHVVSILFLNSSLAWCIGLLGVQVVST